LRAIRRAKSNPNCNRKSNSNRHNHTKIYSSTEVSPQPAPSPYAVAANRLRQVFQRSHEAVIRVYDDAGNVIETHEQTGQLKEW
jgi:hypothetical protein